MLLPALAKAKIRALNLHCMNNFNQMQKAHTMYSTDFSDKFVPNPDHSYYTAGNPTPPASIPGANWVVGDVHGWMPSINSGGGADAGNPDIMRDSKWSLLAPYVGQSTAIFQCPRDPRVAPYSGNNPSLLTKPIKVVRSISMNQGVGTKGPGPFYPTVNSACDQKVDGPWLDGNHGHTADKPYATFGKGSDFNIASPSDIWVMVDDDPWTINDAAMAVIAAEPQFVDYPSPFHDNACGFSFADGHSEIHKWKSNLFIHNGVPARTTAQPGIQFNDWFWWAWHATRSRITHSVP
jgi:prepilin-type processing-associated H-X9-DG protein